MPNYRRAFIPGGTYFFTLKTERKSPIFRDLRTIRSLRKILREAKQRWPLSIDAIDLLSDHLHAIWTLPPGDDNDPVRWAWLKKEFTQACLEQGGREQATSAHRRKNRRRGVWQRKYWEHVLEDEEDYEAHFDSIHRNTVKHGYVTCPMEWPHSSFQQWDSQGVYPGNRGCGQRVPATEARVIEAGE